MGLRSWGPVSEEEEALLTAAVLRVRADEPGAAQALWEMLEARIRMWSWREARRRGVSRVARRDGRPWLLDDLRQEGYVLLLEATAAWVPGEPCFPHMQRDVCRGLRRVWARLMGPARVVPGEPPDREDPWAEEEHAGAELGELASRLRARGLREIDLALLWRVGVMGESVRAAARAEGLAVTSAQRRWAVVREVVAEELRPYHG